MRKLFACLIALLSASAAASVLDKPVSSLLQDNDDSEFSSWFLEGLASADSSVTKDSPIRKVVSHSFFTALPDTRYKSYPSPLIRRFYEGSDSLADFLRFRLFLVGAPANLTPTEIQEFEQDPSAPNFRRIRDLQISGFQGAGTLANTLEANAIFFVTDFLKLYLSEIRKFDYIRFRDVHQISTVRLTKFYKFLGSPQIELPGLVDLDQMTFSTQTRAALAAKGLRGKVQKQILDKSGLGLQAMTEIYLAILQQKSHDSRDVAKACGTLLEHINGSTK